MSDRGMVRVLGVARWLVALWVAGLAWGAPAEACRWFVDGDAEPGGSGDEASPFASLADLLEAPIEGGDLICLREAAAPYEGVTLTGVADGTVEAPVVLTAAPGHAPVIGGRVQLVDLSHWIVRGLTFDGRDAPDATALDVRSIEAPSVGIELRDNLIVRWDGAGILAGDSSSEGPEGIGRDLVIADNRIYDVVRDGIRLRHFEDATIVGNVIDGVACGLGQFDAQSGIAIHTRCQRIEVAHNLVRNLSACAELADLHTQGIRVRLAAGPGQIHHNLVEQVRPGADALFVGGLSLHEGAHDWEIHHNLVRDSDGCGLCDGRDFANELGSTTANLWEHNTVIGADVGIDVGSKATADAALLGNLIVARELGARWINDQSAFTMSHNLYWTTDGGPPRFRLPGGSEVESIADWQEACGCGEGSMAIAPLLDPRDGVTPQPGSPAVDAAHSGPLAFNGSAPDIGALEPPVVGEAVVEPEDPSRVRLSFANAVSPPLLPALGCEGIELRVDAEPVVLVDCQLAHDAVSATTTLSLELAEPLWQGDEAVLRHLGVLTDSTAIGDRLGARVPNFERILDTARLDPRPAIGSAGCGCRRRFVTHGFSWWRWLWLWLGLVGIGRRRSPPR
ncbi:MAG: right-handed parallel beta-helix repeat-containing protein [Myxococcota bacterium]